MEIEAKVKVRDLDAVKQILEERGAVFFKRISQVDHYFKEKGREKEPQGPGSALLRIRELGGSPSGYVTVKKLTEQSGSWIEHETDVGDVEEMTRIFSALDFVEVLVLKKEREQGEYGDFELCLDNIDGLGNYLEVALDSEDKTAARARIMEFFSSLGFDETSLEHRGYPRILFEAQGIQYKDMD